MSDPENELDDPAADSPGTNGSDGATGAPAIPDDIAALGYEEARDELMAIVAQLESGQRGLEESMQLWERGEALAAHCSQWLDAAQERITRSTGGQG